MKNLILFDIDNTLVYSGTKDSQAFADVYQEIFKQQFPSIDWTDFDHVTDEVIFEHAYERHFHRKPTAAEKEDFRSQYVARLKQLRQDNPKDFKAVLGAVEMLKQLSQLPNYHIGIATGGWRTPALVKLQHLGIDPEVLYCGYADNNYTREAIVAEAIHLAEEEIGKVDHVVYFGDASWDVETTRNMNIPFIGIRLEGDIQTLQQLGARDVLTDFEDIESFQHLIRLIERAITPRDLG